MQVLAGQLDRLKKVPSSDELWQTINEFPGMMEEVMDFIQGWLEHWTRTYQIIPFAFILDSSVTVKYILVAAQKGRATELRDKLDSFRDKFMVDLAIETRVKQGLMLVPDFDCPTCLIRDIRCHGEFYGCRI